LLIPEAKFLVAEVNATKAVRTAGTIFEESAVAATAGIIGTDDIITLLAINRVITFFRLIDFGAIANAETFLEKTGIIAILAIIAAKNQITIFDIGDSIGVIAVKNRALADK
jgi:hypothetical protein